MNGSAPERPAAERAPLPGFAVDALLVAVVTLLLYWIDLRFGWFTVDDASYVTENPLVLEPSAAHLRAILTEPYVGNWSPLHLLSYWIDRALGGGEPWVMHLSSNLWAAACAVGVLALGRGLLGSRWAALAAALLFAVHPTHVEAVAWISSRKDLVATAFGLAAWWAWIRRSDAAARGEGSGRWYAASLVLFVLALAGKLSVVVLPAVLLAHDLLIDRRRGIGVLLDKLPHALCVAGFSAVVAGAQPETNVARDAGDLAQIAFGLLVQLAGIGAPSVFRPIPAEIAAWREVVQGAVAIGAVSGVVLLVRRDATLLVLAIAALLALVPAQVLHFVYPVSDRYLFLATAPLALLLAGLAVRLGGARGATFARAAIVTLGLVGCAWTAITVRTLREWDDPRSPWYAASRRVSDINTHEYLGEHWLAAAEELGRARAAGLPLPEPSARIAEAIGYDERRLAILRREWEQELPHRPLTDALARDLLDRAGEQLDLALAIPTERALPSLVYRRARLHGLRGENERALREFERAYAEAARYPVEAVSQLFRVRSLQSMGLMAERQGDLERALALVRRALAEQRSFAPPSPELERELEREAERLEREVGSR